MKTKSQPGLDETLVSPEFLADPYPVLRQLRENDPIHWSDSIGGWVLTKYEDIVTTFKATDQYSNEGRLARVVEYLPAEARSQLSGMVLDRVKTRIDLVTSHYFFELESPWESQLFQILTSSCASPDAFCLDEGAPTESNPRGQMRSQSVVLDITARRMIESLQLSQGPRSTFSRSRMPFGNVT